MEQGKFDLEGLVKWGVSKALDHGSNKTGLPLGELAQHITPLINEMKIPAIEIDPFMMTMGRIVLAGMERNRKIQEAMAKSKEASNDSSG